MSDRPLKDTADVVGADPRAGREAEDRLATENREVTDADRLLMFQQQLFNDALPDLPRLAGFHLCWLTTTNPSDTIHKRQQIGYSLLTTKDAPGLEYTSLKTGEYAGCIAVNEMLAAKLPMALYEAFMQEVHHKAPLGEEEKLNALVDSLRQRVEKDGGTLMEGDGMQDLRAPQPQKGYFV